VVQLFLGQVNMATDWETIFRNWASPPSQTEQTKCDNTLGIIRNAVNADRTLSQRNISVLAQGSYRNHTNVRADSDVDICVLCRDTFYYDLPDGMTSQDFSIGPATYLYPAYKDDLENALVSYLGRSAITRGNKAFDIHENTYRVDADVVACFDYHWYLKNRTYLEGTSFLTDQGVKTINWPEQNYANSNKKNDATERRFKALVRIMKNLRNAMADNGSSVAKNMPSYLIECLIWNVPNEGFGHSNYADDVRYVLVHLYNKTVKPEDCNEWGEINELKYLFRPPQSWTLKQANDFLVAAWNYVGFE
jgi:hypothetical protein